jgi:hypothetical protein
MQEIKRTFHQTMGEFGWRPKDAAPRHTFRAAVAACVCFTAPVVACHRLPWSSSSVWMPNRAVDVAAVFSAPYLRHATNSVWHLLDIIQTYPNWSKLSTYSLSLINCRYEKHAGQIFLSLTRCIEYISNICLSLNKFIKKINLIVYLMILIMYYNIWSKLSMFDFSGSTRTTVKKGQREYIANIFL